MNRESNAKLPTRLLDGLSSDDLAEAADMLRGGEIVALPTDTVYGVGVVAFNGEAIERLYSMKQRPSEKGIPILLADQADLARVCREIPTVAQTLIERFWPGPLTLIVPRRAELPDVISSNDTIAVRIPNNVIARDLIRAAGGALATSSANVSRHPPATTGPDALISLDGLVAAVVDGGPSPGDLSSTIVDCSSSTLRILRRGPISAADLGLTEPPQDVS